MITRWEESGRKLDSSPVAGQGYLLFRPVENINRYFPSSFDKKI